MADKISLLHIYGQSHWHDYAILYGNREGLLSLKYAIEEALIGDDGHGLADLFTSDGEGYGVVVRRDDRDFQDEAWTQLALPYTDEIAEDRETSYRKPVSPWDRVNREWLKEKQHGL